MRYTNVEPPQIFQTIFLSFYNGDIEPVALFADSRRFRPLTERLISMIRRTWPSPHDASDVTGHKSIFKTRLCLENPV